jgi:alpha-tubulin suppressor-like RCC1 family protein
VRPVVVGLGGLILLLSTGGAIAAASVVRPIHETLVAGFSHTCAIVSTGVQCAGENASGELGDGNVEEFGFTATPDPVDVAGFSGTPKAIAAGLLHTCALSADGFVRCWGANYYGQLGTGDRIDSPQPRTVMGGVSSIALGNSHSCAVTTRGEAMCWGLNEHGEIGNGDPGCVDKCFNTHPEEVRGLNGLVRQLALGDGFSCAVTIAGDVRCWGDGYGPSPVGISGLKDGVVAISAGIGHACALTEHHAVECWGDDEFGQLGDGKHGVGRRIPRAVEAVAGGAVAIAAGGHHTCAVKHNGAVGCWGRNDYGELGDGTTTNRDEAVAVKGLGTGSGVTEISVGYQFSCVAFDGDEIKCWGKNDVGQLGDGTTTTRKTPAQTKFGGPSVSFIVHEKGRQALKGKGHRFELTTITGFGRIWLSSPLMDNRQIGIASATGTIRVHRWRIFEHGVVDEDDFTVEFVGNGIPLYSLNLEPNNWQVIQTLAVSVKRSDAGAKDECRRGQKGTIDLQDHGPSGSDDVIDLDVCGLDRPFVPRKSNGTNIKVAVAMTPHSRPEHR